MCTRSQRNDRKTLLAFEVLTLRIPDMVAFLPFIVRVNVISCLVLKQKMALSFPKVFLVDLCRLISRRRLGSPRISPVERFRV
jgi:hypothetical protein